MIKAIDVGERMSQKKMGVLFKHDEKARVSNYPNKKLKH